MTRRARLQDNTVLEFDDDTPDHEIDRAVREHTMISTGRDIVDALNRLSDALAKPSAITVTRDGTGKILGAEVHRTGGMDIY